VALGRELRGRLGVGDMALVLQQSGLRRCGHVLRRDDDDWVKRCVECEVEGRAREDLERGCPRGLSSS